MHKSLSKILVLFFIFSLSISFLPASQDQVKCLTAQDYFNLESASDPQISPDGKKIIYVRRFADMMSDKFYSNLWIIDFDGTGHRPITSGLYHDSSPRWSPDGGQIIFISDREGKPQIHKRWMDTGQTVVLTNLQFPPSGITWSPDGKNIAYSSGVPSPPRTVVKLPTAPPGAKWAKPAAVIDRLFYRFDGIGYLIGQGYMHLFVMPSDGGTPRQISQGNFHHPFAFAGDAALWTPDSKSILLSTNRSKDWELDPLNTEIYEFSIADGSINALTDRRGPDNSPAVSPDGKHIAYTGFDDRYQGFQLTYLYVMNRDGSQPRKVAMDLDRSVGGVVWSSDSKGIFFTYADQGNTKLAHTTLDGKVKKLANDLGRGGLFCGKKRKLRLCLHQPRCAF